jgi:hypothetical protein
MKFVEQIYSIVARPFLGGGELKFTVVYCHNRV